MIQAGGVSINKHKSDDIGRNIILTDLMNQRYLLIQKGKKNYVLVRTV